MKNKKTPVSRNTISPEETLKWVSRKHSKLLYGIVIVSLCLLQVVNFFAVSNFIEFIVAVLALLLLVALSMMKGKIWRWVMGFYVMLLIVCLFVTALTHVPFFGVFSTKKPNPEKYYAGFAEALYDFSVRNYDESLSEFKKIKKMVPDDDLIDYYIWYYDASTRAKEYDLCTKLSKELQERKTDPNEYERKVLFQFFPIGDLIITLNKQDYSRLLVELKPYMETNEQIFSLLELIAMIQLDNSLSRDEVMLKLEAIQQCIDTFENYGYIKRELWKVLDLDFYTREDYDFDLIALAELYALDPAEFFNDFIFEHPLYYNPGNTRWISLEELAFFKDIFHKGTEQIKQSGYELNHKIKEKITNFGLFLGVPMAISETADVTCLYSILSNYTEDAEIYNIVRVNDKTYVFSVLENEILDIDKTKFSGIATKADFYLADIDEDVVVEPLYINGEPFQVGVMMDKLMIVQDTGIPKKLLLTQISGTSEYLSLSVLDLTEGTETFLPLDDMYYHTGDFSYDIKTQTCSWSFEIYNSYDSNVQTKVGGNVTAKIDFDRCNIEVEKSYADPALQLYATERNSQLIFPLATLNKLGGREIKDTTFLSLIRNNSMPYYNYSIIQYVYGYMSEMYAPNISGITISYPDEENINGQSHDYFFLTKREDDEIKLLGIYHIVDSKLKSVY